MDEKLFAGLGENAKRNRRMASTAMVILGAILGGFVTKKGDIGLALWLVSIVKGLMAASWMFWRPKEGRIRLG